MSAPQMHMQRRQQKLEE